MFYSKSTGGFYVTEIHGVRTLTVTRPGWVHPTIEVPSPNWSEADAVDGASVPMVTIDDPTVVAPTVEVPNPDCKIPGDAVEITQEQRDALSQGEIDGKVITADADGYPVLTDPPPIPLPVLIEAAKARVRYVRTGLFATLAGMQSKALTDGDMDTARAISGIQDKLKALTDIDVSHCVTQADIDAAFVSAWQLIAASVPQAVQSAFNEVLS